MNRMTLGAASLALAALAMNGCSGSDSQPVTSTTPDGPIAEATDDVRTPVSDALTPDEAAQVNRAESEPVPAHKSDS